MTRVAFAFPLVAFLALAGCTSTRYVQIRHPMQVGTIDANAVPFEARRQESELGLPPGALIDEARLTEVSADQICADVTLWNVETNTERGIYENYRISLLNDREGVEQAQSRVELQQPTITPTPGHIQRTEQVGTRRVCSRWVNGRCTRFRNEPVFRTYYEPHVWQVQDNPARICFANGGFVTPETGRVALEFQFVTSPNRFVFEWQFLNAVQR